jgi:hypothetical protein
MVWSDYIFAEIALSGFAQFWVDGGQSRKNPAPSRGIAE